MLYLPGDVYKALVKKLNRNQSTFNNYIGEGHPHVLFSTAILATCSQPTVNGTLNIIEANETCT